MAEPDTNTYRTSGDWGAGKGSNLTPAEVDENFWGLVLRLVTLEDDPNEGVGIADFSVSGTALTVFMTDGSTRGPFVLPAANFRFAGEWEPGETYQFMDIFTVSSGADSGLYWVLAEYTAPDGTDPVFDPDVTTTDDGPLLQLMLPGSVPQETMNIIRVVDADITLGDEDAGSYVRMVSDDPHKVFVDLGVTYPEGATYVIRQAGDGEVEIESLDTDMTITPPPGFTLVLRGKGASATLFYAGDNEWDASGDFTPEP